MGNCAGKELQASERTFKVTNINDNHVLVRKGFIIVTETQLVYIDSKSKQEWEWPFKYLRRYGCEGNVFSFEAGRKCTNGEGTYAFVCNKANELFNIVAKNIAQGNVQPDLDNNGTLNDNPLRRSLEVATSPPELPSQPLPSLPPPPPPPPTSDSAPRPSLSDPTSTNPPPHYTHLVFTNESTEMIHSSNDHTPYSKIAFDKTEELSRQSKKKVSLSDIKLVEGRSREGRRHTEGSSNRRRKKAREHRSSSLSSNSSTIETPTNSTALHPSISESIPETTTGGRDTSLINESSYQNLLIQDGDIKELLVPVESTSTITEQPNYSNIDLAPVEQPNYSNVDVSKGEIIQQSSQQLPDYSNVNIEEEQPNYSNLIPGQGIVSSSTPLATPTQKRQPDYFNFTPGSDMTTPSMIDQPNYTNITTDRVGGASLIEDPPNYTNLNIGNGGSGDLPQRSHTFNHADTRPHSNSRSTTLPAATRGTYAVLNLPNSHYAQLDIKGGETSIENHNVTSTSVSSGPRDRSVSSLSRLTEDPHTDYTVLNFKAMDVIHSMREERDKDILEKEKKEKEIKEKELAAKQQQQDKLHNKKTGKGHKK